jgi:hypothetical protein
MVYKHLAPFDPSRDFVCQTFFRAAGVACERDAPFDKSLVDARVLRILYENHKIGYADPSAGEEKGSLAPAAIEAVGGGWYAISVPWLDEPEKVQGEGPATLRAQQLRDEGEPAEHHGVAVVEGENGWWTVNALWLIEPETVHGQEAAHERAAELRKAGPPADWNPDALIGSDNFEASYQIGDETVELGVLVAAAQEASGHEPKVWNAMEAGQRDELIQAELDRRTKAAEKPGDGGGGDAGDALKIGDVVLVALEGNELDGKKGIINSIEGDEAEVYSFDAGDELHKVRVPLANLSITEPDPRPDAGEGDEAAKAARDAKIAALVEANTTAQLTALAEGLDGLASAKGKTAIATLIVDAGRDAKAGDGGGAD